MTRLDEKSAVRKYLNGVYTSVDPSCFPIWNRAIVKHILCLPLYQAARTISLFFPLSDEPDIRPVIKNALKQGKTVTLPCIERDTMVFREMLSENGMEKGPFSVLQPMKKSPIIPLSFIDVFFLPGQAFDRKGNRLGRGQGWYDRILADVKNPKIGISYDFRFIDVVKYDAYDISMTGIITEKGFFSFFNE